MQDAIDHLNAALAGRYTVEHQVGEGGMATVYERFLSEIRVTANLQHSTPRQYAAPRAAMPHHGQRLRVVKSTRPVETSRIEIVTNSPALLEDPR
jgi:hypothetical protein